MKTAPAATIGTLLLGAMALSGTGSAAESGVPEPPPPENTRSAVDPQQNARAVAARARLETVKRSYPGQVDGAYIVQGRLHAIPTTKAAEQALRSQGIVPEPGKVPEKELRAKQQRFELALKKQGIPFPVGIGTDVEYGTVSVDVLDVSPSRPAVTDLARQFGVAVNVITTQEVPAFSVQPTGGRGGLP